MKTDVLVSTMNCIDEDKLLKEMNLRENYVIINQITNQELSFPKNEKQNNKER